MKLPRSKKLYIWLSILTAAGIITGYVMANNALPGYDVVGQKDLPNWITLLIEIIIGIAIALIVYNHAKKIEDQEKEDLKLAIRGTYYSLWNLYHAMFAYSRSDAVRTDRISGLQILNIIQTVRNTLSKCAQSIDPLKIEIIQVDLSEMQEIVRSSIDPRSNVEELWQKNSGRFCNAMSEIRKISIENFEPLIPEASRSQWPVES